MSQDAARYSDGVCVYIHVYMALRTCTSVAPIRRREAKHQRVLLSDDPAQSDPQNHKLLNEKNLRRYVIVLPLIFVAHDRRPHDHGIATEAYMSSDNGASNSQSTNGDFFLIQPTRSIAEDEKHRVRADDDLGARQLHCSAKNKSDSGVKSLLGHSKRSAHDTIPLI